MVDKARSVVSDLDLARACATTYSGAPPTWGTDTVHVFLSAALDGTQVIAFEGTHDAAEWLVDFEAVPVDERGFRHETLGDIHLGWWLDVEAVADRLLEWVAEHPGPIACTGHSKGAGEALIFAALAITKGVAWSRVSTFGTPHPGALNGLVTSRLGRDYRNRLDPVPLLPWYLGRPRPLTEVRSPESKTEDPAVPDAISDHFIQNYVAALQAAESNPGD